MKVFWQGCNAKSNYCWPGWYVSDDTRIICGPFASKQAAMRAREAYGT